MTLHDSDPRCQTCHYRNTDPEDIGWCKQFMERVFDCWCWMPEIKSCQK